MQGYQEAEKIDKLINKLLEQYPITKHNASEWMKFARTIGSGTEIINDFCKIELTRKD